MLPLGALAGPAAAAPVPGTVLEHPVVVLATGLWGLSAIAAFAAGQHRIGYAIALTGGAVGLGLAVVAAVDKRRDRVTVPA